jgi:hypothetical protein
MRIAFVALKVASKIQACEADSSVVIFRLAYVCVSLHYCYQYIILPCPYVVNSIIRIDEFATGIFSDIM